jgi:hypothetical protein
MSEREADASHEATFSWEVETPTSWHQHVVYGTRGSIAALRAKLEQAVAEERRACEEIIRDVARKQWTNGTAGYAAILAALKARSAPEPEPEKTVDLMQALVESLKEKFGEPKP